ARARAVSRAVKEVAHYLGNTPAVCRASYIDPRVVDRYRSGLTIAGALEQLGEVGEPGEPAHQGPIEEAVLDLIEDKQAPAPELHLIAGPLLPSPSSPGQPPGICCAQPAPRRHVPDVRVQAGRREPLGSRERGRPPPAPLRPGPGPPL